MIIANKLLHKKVDCFDYTRKLDIVDRHFFDRMVVDASKKEIINNLDKLDFLNIKVCYRCMSEATAQFVWRRWSNYGER